MPILDRMDAALAKASLDNAKTTGIVLSQEDYERYLQSSSPHRTQDLAGTVEVYRGTTVTEATDDTSPSFLHVVAPDGLKSPVEI